MSSTAHVEDPSAEDDFDFTRLYRLDEKIGEGTYGTVYKAVRQSVAYGGDGALCEFPFTLRSAAETLQESG